MKIDKIDLTRLCNDDHFQFHSNFLDMLTSAGAEELNIKSLFDVYVPSFANLDAAYKKIRKSIFTEQIREADKARDKVWQSFVAACKAALKHPDPNVQLSAKKLKILIDTYGKIDKKSLLGQTAATYNILQDLTGAYTADVAALGVGRLVTELRILNSRCNDLMNERNDEEAAKNNAVYKNSRGDIDGDYRKITERLDALVVVEGVALYENFIKTWNVHIARFVAIIKGKKSGKNSKNNENSTLNTTEVPNEG